MLAASIVRLNDSLMIPLRGTLWISFSVPVYSVPFTVSFVSSGSSVGAPSHSNTIGYVSTMMPVFVFTLAVHSGVSTVAEDISTVPSPFAVPVTAGIVSSAFSQGETLKVTCPSFSICFFISAASYFTPLHDSVSMVALAVVCGLYVTLKHLLYIPSMNSICS